jgi:hypothetical protein
MIRKGLLALILVAAAAVVYADGALAAIKTDYGASFRLRQEYWENVTDLQTLGQSDRDYFRLRTSVWAKMDVNENLGAYLRLTNEAKYYFGAYTPFASSAIEDQRDKRFDIDELIVDNLYFDAKKVFGLPVDLRVGRQDFLGQNQYGEGFLLLDGTPGDGSRSFYFNAIKATTIINNNNSVDLVYIYQPQKDELLPSLHPNRSQTGYIGDRKQLNASDEKGVVVYGRSKLNDNLNVEPYYIYKVEDPVGTNTTLNLNTVGARVVYAIDTWKVRAEYAHQFGKYENTDRDRKGNGGYIFAGQKFAKAYLKPEWEVGYVYLSGDDPSTGNHEGWDPLFSRGPMWNELLIYTMIPETSKDGGPIPGYWTNLQLFKLGLKLSLSDATQLALSYQNLRADQATSGLATDMFSNGGKDRGHLGTMILTHVFTKQIDGMLQVEYFAPGNFYADSAKKAVFARWQLQYKF